MTAFNLKLSVMAIQAFHSPFRVTMALPFSVSIILALQVGSVAFAQTTKKAAAAQPGSLRDAQETNTPGSVFDLDSPIQAAEKGLVPKNIVFLGSQSGYYSSHAFVVDKKSRTLTVWQSDQTGIRRLASYPADMGRRNGDKKAMGDFKTPNGIYFPQEKLEGANLDFSLYGKRAFTLNYPNFFDRAEGKTGSGIWLHAVPDTVPLTRGSRGCVVVRNDVLLDISQYVQLEKTPVLIEDEVQYVSGEDHTKFTQEFQSLLESWRTAWETKDIDNYIGNYATNFNAQKMSRTEWRDYKARLNQTYKTLRVAISKPQVLVYGDKAIARFVQSYTSDQHSDSGEKTLYMTKEDGRFKIVGEDWVADSGRLAFEELKASSASYSAQAIEQARSQASVK